MDALAQDLRFAWRRIRRTPGFTIIAILSLALGIGANTALFTIADAVLFTRPDLERPEELVDVYYQQTGFEYAAFSYPDFMDLANDTDVFTAVAASRFTFAQRDADNSVESIPAELVSGEYFRVRGLRPAAGRLLGPEDDRVRGGHPVVVLSHSLWQRAYGGDPAAIGQDVRLNGSNYTIVGVAPADYHGHLKGLEPSFYVPILMLDRMEPGTSSQLDSRTSHSIFATARLAPGVELARAQATVDNFSVQMRETFPDVWLGENGITLVPTLDVVMHPLVDRVIKAAAGALAVVVGLVLLIACANLASFLLAQARDRRKEIAIRLALGAKRWTLVRQLLTETTLLALCAGVVGTGIAVFLLGWLQAADLPLPFPITLDLTPDMGVLFATFVVSLGAGALFGLAPALQSTNPDVAPTLKSETVGGGKPRRLNMRSALVASQVAASLVLLVVASLFLRSLAERTDIRVGFGEEPAAVVSFGVPGDRYERAEGRLLLRRVLDEVRALPEVTAVGMTENLHLNVLNTSWADVRVPGVEPPPGQDVHYIDAADVDGGFFDAAGVDLLRGRVFDDRIDLVDGPPVAVVNQAFVDRFWPGDDALERMIRVEDDEVRIVGVVETVKIRTMGEPPRPYLYRPYSQRYTSYPTIVARTVGPADGTAAEIFSILRRFDPDLVIVETKTMDRHLGALLVPFRLGAVIMGGVAVLALMLAVIGLYGVVSYAVASRTREVGIRMSLGADRWDVVRMVMGGGLRLVAVGGVIGLVVAAAGASLLRGLLYGVPPLDPISFMGVPALLGIVAILAAWLPARRASRVDPVRALKAD